MRSIRYVLGTAFIALAFCGLVVAEQPQQPQQKGPQAHLMFFMNPNGMPCQMQDNIIHQAGDAITGTADIVYVKTTVTADRKLFYTYGIRALPSLVLTDTKGNELHRFPAGIQSRENIMKALKKVNVKGEL